MMKTCILPITLAVGTLIGATASAHSRSLQPENTAGLWTGVTTGTFQGAPYAASSTLSIARDGQTAVETDDSPNGPSTSSCKLVSFASTGLAKVHCVQTAGFAVGFETDVSYVLTDNEQQLIAWISVPSLGLFLTAHFYRP
jgi:hypothetical protein